MIYKIYASVVVTLRFQRITKNDMMDLIQIWPVDVTCPQGMPDFKVT